MKVAQGAAFLFGTMCSLRERDAHCVRDAFFGRDVRFARELEHITSLRAKASNITVPKGTTSRRQSRCFIWRR